MGWLSFLMNPAMLGIGALAVMSPILIHLLNKRRFKIVEWAAMDFLFQAEKKNRRRVRIENLILLLLRCLAMILIGLLLARPFLPSSVASVLQEAQKIERIVVLDDSLSQRVRNGAETSFELSRNSIKQLLTGLADSPDTEDWLTLMVTSRPDEPVMENMPVSRTTIPSMMETIDRLDYADNTADYADVFNFLRGYVSSSSTRADSEGVNRVAYVYSDMRSRDWENDSADSGDAEPVQLMEELAAGTLNSFVIDVGSTSDDNLAVTSLLPDGLQVADKIVPFSIGVTNFGKSTVTDVRVLFQVDEDNPKYETIPSIAPGATEFAGFYYMFNRPQSRSVVSFGSSDDDLPKFKNYRVRAAIDRPSLDEEALAADGLLEDSSSVFASRVLNGIPVLLVDGDPSDISERSETHYLKHLDLAGTGLDVRVGSITDLETGSLSDYRIIYLCNVSQVTSERMKTLSQWVSEGGALVIMPGDNVRVPEFNRTFYAGGEGLSPLRLTGVQGNSLTLDTWVNFEVDPKIHPALQLVVDIDATSLTEIETFSWFTSEYDEEKAGREFDIPLRFSDPVSSPAMVDRPVGDGRVIMFTIPADGDWSVWAGNPTYALVMLYLVDYLAGGSPDDSMVEIGGTITWPVDLSAYLNRVSMLNPKEEKQETVAAPMDDSEEAGASELYRATFNRIRQRGFHELGLTRHAGQTEQVLFAANYDPEESDLSRISSDKIANDLFSSEKIKVVSTADLDKQAVQGGTTEIWPMILFLLFGVLMLEQFLAWQFGRKR